MGLYLRKQLIDILARNIERFVHVRECGIDIFGCEAASVLFPLRLSRRCHTVWVGVTAQPVEGDPERDEQRRIERDRRQGEPKAHRVNAWCANDSCQCGSAARWVQAAR